MWETAGGVDGRDKERVCAGRAGLVKDHFQPVLHQKPQSYFGGILTKENLNVPVIATRVRLILFYCKWTYDDLHLFEN